MTLLLTNCVNLFSSISMSWSYQACPAQWNSNTDGHDLLHFSVFEDQCRNNSWNVWRREVHLMYGSIDGTAGRATWRWKCWSKFLNNVLINLRLVLFCFYYFHVWHINFIKRTERGKIRSPERRVNSWVGERRYVGKEREGEKEVDR